MKPERRDTIMRRNMFNGLIKSFGSKQIKILLLCEILVISLVPIDGCGKDVKSEEAISINSTNAEENVISDNTENESKEVLAEEDTLDANNDEQENIKNDNAVSEQSTPSSKQSGLSKQNSASSTNTTSKIENVNSKHESSSGNTVSSTNQSASKDNDGDKTSVGMNSNEEQVKSVCEHVWKSADVVQEYTCFKDKNIYACNECGIILINKSEGIDIVVDHLMETNTHGAWHSESLEQAYCYFCGDYFSYRQCGWEKTCCKKSENFALTQAYGGSYFLYYDTCKCGENVTMVDAETGKGLILVGTEQQCIICGETK